MTWDHEQFVNFVRTHAPPAERSSLLQAAQRPYSPDYPKIFLTYYSMPDWLDVFSSRSMHDPAILHPKTTLQDRLGTTPFHQMIGEYKHAAKKHHDKIAENLDRIVTYPSGKALLKEAGSTRYAIRIMPYWHYFVTMPGKDIDNATAWPIKRNERLSTISLGTPTDEEDAHQKGAPVRDENNEPMAGRMGTGRGANVVVFYSAEIWENKEFSKDPAHQPDEVLFHELAHATRMIRGRETSVPMDGGGYGNIEEYFATVLTNIYLSDKGVTRLRGLYSNVLLRRTREYVKIGETEVMVIIKPLPKDWDVMKEPGRFYENPDRLSISPRQLMQIFSNTQRSFYLDLAHLPPTRPTFNPPRQHFRESFRPNI